MAAECSHLQGWGCSSQESAARAGNQPSIPAEGIPKAPGPFLEGSREVLVCSGDLGSAEGTKWSKHPL